MNNTHDERASIYEIGYLIAGSVPEEKVPEQNQKLKDIIVSRGASVIAEGAPHRQDLSYTIRKKTLSGSYEKHNQGYFGWIKFEIGSNKIEDVKKTFENDQAVLRMLLITTVRENTFLGKHAGDVVSHSTNGRGIVLEITTEEEKPVTTISLEEMDKSIDELVKET